MNRRGIVVSLGLIGLATTALGGVGRRSLRFEHLHTGERISADYRSEHGYDRGALREIDYAMRDWRTGDIMPIDPKLLDFLFEVQQTLGNSAAIQVICGYRSPATNAMLRARSQGVARKSLHLEGRAIDMVLPGTSIIDLRDTALRLERGGVGTYSRSGFVHLDTGRFRRWGS